MSNDFYDLKDMLPAVYGKYIIVKSHNSGCLFSRLFSVADAILASRTTWRGYNVFVDWYDDDSVQPFHKYFRLDIKNEFATNYSDMPESTLTTLCESVQHSDILKQPPTEELSSYSGVKVCGQFDLSTLDLEGYNVARFLRIFETSVKPLWNYAKSVRGFNKDKYRGSRRKNVIGCDMRSVTDSNRDSVVDAITVFIRDNLNSRVFLSGTSELHFKDFQRLFKQRSGYRKPKYEDIYLNELLSVLQLGLCDSIIGADDSYIHTYASVFFERTDCITV